MTFSIRSQGELARLHRMEQLAARRERTSRQLASGKRITGAADDAAGLAVATRFAAAERGMAQGANNLAAGQDLVRTAEATLQTSQDDLARMRELSMQARNGTLSDADRAVVQQEYDALAAGLDQTASGTSFAGRNLLDGSSGGNAAVVVGDGSGGDHALDLPDARAAALGVAGRDVAAAATVDAVDAASAQLARARGRLGTADRSLESHARQLGAAGASLADARSRIEDVDVAVATAAQTRDRILQGLQLAGARAERARRPLLDVIG